MESVVTQHTDHTPVFPLEEPKPTSMFQGSALLQEVEPKIKSISIFIPARRTPLPTLRSYCKPCYQDSKLPKLLVLVLCVGLSGPILEVKRTSELGESLVSHLVLLACSNQMNHPEHVAWSQAYSISFNPHTFNKTSIVNTAIGKG